VVTKYVSHRTLTESLGLHYHVKHKLSEITKVLSKNCAKLFHETFLLIFILKLNYFASNKLPVFVNKSKHYYFK